MMHTEHKECSFDLTEVWICLWTCQKFHQTFVYAGSLDFVPAKLSAGGSSAQYEPLSTLLQKANQWMQQNPALPVCNIQSLDYQKESTRGMYELDK